MIRLSFVLAVFLLLIGGQAFAQAPELEFLGVTEHSSTSFEYSYAAHNPSEATNDVTDIHLEGNLAWNPAHVTVQAPGGWDAEIVGPFINWTVQGTGGISPGGTVTGISIFVDELWEITSWPVHWTDDPLVTPWQDNVFATTVTDGPVPEPTTLSLLALGGLALLRRSRG